MSSRPNQMMASARTRFPTESRFVQLPNADVSPSNWNNSYLNLKDGSSATGIWAFIAAPGAGEVFSYTGSFDVIQASAMGVPTGSYAHIRNPDQTGIQMMLATSCSFIDSTDYSLGHFGHEFKIWSGSPGTGIQTQIGATAGLTNGVNGAMRFHTSSIPYMPTAGSPPDNWTDPNHLYFTLRFWDVGGVLVDDVYAFCCEAKLVTPGQYRLGL